MNFKLVVFYGVISCVSAIEPFSAFGAIGAVVAGIYTAFTPIKCHFNECCSSKWINLNTTALREDLQRRLYGQHLVTKVVIRYLKFHMTKDPSKALTLSFHGGTGTGKNYVSRIIAESIYKEGMRSKFVHLISATTIFPYRNNVHLYKEILRDLVESSVKECPQSLFIIEEVDKMQEGIFDMLKPYFDFHKQIGGTDYRKAMFLILSNTGGEDISKHALNNWHSKSKREDIGLKEMEQIIRKAIMKDKTSGMYGSNIIDNYMISAFVPFLPMERKHIKECIKDFLVAKKYYKREDIPEYKVNEIAQELNYYPTDMEIFSVTGCKRVQEKVTYVMDWNEDW